MALTNGERSVWSHPTTKLFLGVIAMVGTLLVTGVTLLESRLTGMQDRIAQLEVRLAQQSQRISDNAEDLERLRGHLLELFKTTKALEAQQKEK